MPIDLRAQTRSGLRNLLANSRRLRNAEMELAVVREMHDRGMATGREYAMFPWNQDRVDHVMEPFVRVAAKVPDNQRTRYTKAGGRKIGIPRGLKEHRWIDSYSATKTIRVNAVFGCEIARPGDDPLFTLYFTSDPRREATPIKTYNADQLHEALIEWENIARSAGAPL